MDTHASAGRLFALPTASNTTLQTSGDSPVPQYRRGSPGSESGSTSDGAAAHHAQRPQQAPHGFQAPQATFGGENPDFNAALRLDNASATVFVDDPPYDPSGSSHSSQTVQYSQTQANPQFSPDFFDYHVRPPSSATQSPPQLSARRHSGESSPAGSEHSQESDRSAHLSSRSYRSASSGTSGHASQYTGMNAPMEEPYHVPQPATPALAFNPARYPAFDATGERRIGLEHVNFEHSQHVPGQYYRQRTATYPLLNDGPHVMNISFDEPPPVDMPAYPPRHDAMHESLQLPAAQIALETRPAVMSDHAPLVSSPEPFPHHTTASHSPQPGTHVAAPDIPDPTPNLRKLLGLAPDEEVSLFSLADPRPGEKPNYPYPTLIKLAIHGSPKKRLTLQEIYGALEDRFQWFRDNREDKAWQNSIRHNLSLNKTFRKVTKPITEPGKGSYWVVDYSQGEGNKRVRKRNKRPTKAELARRAQETSTSRQESSSSEEEHGGTQSPAGGSGMSQSQSQSSSASTSHLEDFHIDPELRNQGHVVGHGRIRSAGAATRSSARRAHSPYIGGSSPGPSHSRVATPGSASQMPPPQMMPQLHMSTQERAQQQVALGQYASFGQPAFAPTAFGQPPVSQSQMNWIQQMSHMPVQSPAPAAPQMAMPRVARASRSASAASSQDLDIRNAPIRQPTPRPGIQHVRDASGFVVARRIDSGSGGPVPGTGLPQQQQQYYAQSMPSRGGGLSSAVRRNRSSSGSSRE